MQWAYSLLRILLWRLWIGGRYHQKDAHAIGMPAATYRKLQSGGHTYVLKLFGTVQKGASSLSSDLQPIIKRVRGLRLIFKVKSLLLQFVSSSSNAPILWCSKAAFHRKFPHSFCNALLKIASASMAEFSPSSWSNKIIKRVITISCVIRKKIAWGNVEKLILDQKYGLKA